MARALAFASSLREGIHEEHAEQVARLATLTAEHLGLPVGVVLRCRLPVGCTTSASWRSRSTILTKPGPLDDAEWAIMRTHAAVGATHRPPRGRPAARPRPPSATTTSATPAAATPTASPGRDPHRGANHRRSRRLRRDDGDAALLRGEGTRDAAAELRRSAGSHLDPAVVESLLAVLGLADRVERDAA